MGSVADTFKDNSYQFVARYTYDSGENSALGVISPVFIARENLDETENFWSGSSGLTVTINDNYPKYAKYMDVYARRGNNGTWYRVKTFNIDEDKDGSDNLIFQFTGDLFEPLNSIESSKPFDTIPLDTKNIEVADNRVFLANNNDEFDSGDSGLSISLQTDSQFLTDSASPDFPISYLRYSSDSARRISGFEAEEYASPWANDSVYKIGVSLYDEYLRTRGVEDIVTFETGNFDYPIYPDVRVSKSGTIPSWAKYYQLVTTKNLSKDYTFEGYASDYFWIKNDTVGTRLRELDVSTKGDIKFFVLDIAGMIRSGYVYNFQDGDRININFDVTAAADENSNTKILRNLRVLGQSDNLVYVEFSAKDGFDADAWNATLDTELYRLFFEIYSPTASQDTVIYYESGKIRPITDFDSSLNVDFNLASTEGYLQGDMAFQNIEVKGYSATSIPVDDSLPTDTSLDEDYKVLVRKVDATKAGSDWDVSIGKALIEYDGKERGRSISKIRWGGKYVQGTSLNPISSFSFDAQSEVPYENGPINALQRTNKTQEDGSVMLAICERETVTLYLNESVLNDVNGNSFVATSDKVIGTVRNLKGSFGTSNKRSVVQYQGNVYFWDGIKKRVVRYGANGLFPISDYGMKSYFRDKSGDCRGYYDPFHNMYFIAFDSDDSGVMSVSAGFSEGRDRWTSFFNHPITVGVARDDKMVLFNGQNYYESLGSSAAFRVYGTEQDANITFVMNSQTPEKPLNVKVYTSMDVVDYSNANNVETDIIEMTITNENGQSTTIVEENLLLERDVLYAHVLRDENSVGGLLDGDHIEGSVHEIKADFKSSTQETRINGIIVSTIPSQGHMN